jgi:hypothetical protein
MFPGSGKTNVLVEVERMLGLQPSIAQDEYAFVAAVFAKGFTVSSLFGLYGEVWPLLISLTSLPSKHVAYAMYVSRCGPCTKPRIAFDLP